MCIWTWTIRRDAIGDPLWLKTAKTHKTWSSTNVGSGCAGLFVRNACIWHKCWNWEASQLLMMIMMVVSTGNFIIYSPTGSGLIRVTWRNNMVWVHYYVNCGRELWSNDWSVSERRVKRGWLGEMTGIIRLSTATAWLNAKANEDLCVDMCWYYRLRDRNLYRLIHKTG